MNKEKSMTNVGKASVSAVKWSAVSTIGRFGLQLIAQVVLARILGPDNYGLFGIGMVVYTFGNFFSSFGFGRNLLQKIEISADDIRFAFTWQCITGGIATLGIFLAAPLLALYFNEPRSTIIIQWLSLACLLNAAAAPANNLLQRDLKFKATGLIQVGSYGVGYLGFGIPMALNGYGVYALVTAWLTQAGITLLATYWLHPHSLKPLLWFDGAKTAFGYGGTVFFTNIVNWMLTNLDRVVIGRVLDTQAFGLYTAGYNLATMPNTFLLSSLQTAFLASGAKLQADIKRLGESFLQVLATIWVLLVPVFVFLAVISPELVTVLYGPKWQDTATVLSILFLGMPGFVIWGLSTPILWNTGRQNYESLLQLPILAIGGILLFAYAGQGITMAASLTTGILLLRGAVMSHSAMRAVGIGYRKILPHMARGILLSLISAGAAYIGKQIGTTLTGLTFPLMEAMLAIKVENNSTTSIVLLVTSSFTALVLFFSILLFFPKLLGKDAMLMLGKFAPKLVKHK